MSRRRLTEGPSLLLELLLVLLLVLLVLLTGVADWSCCLELLLELRPPPSRPLSANPR